jgi:hypothetical protein
LHFLYLVGEVEKGGTFADGIFGVDDAIMGGIECCSGKNRIRLAGRLGVAKVGVLLT